MIKPEIYYVLTCDRCRESFEDYNGFTARSGKFDMWDDAKEEGWIEFEGKHFCPECQENHKGKMIPKPRYPEAVFKIEKFLKTYVGYHDTRIKEEENRFVLTTTLKTKEGVAEDSPHIKMIEALLSLEEWEWKQPISSPYNRQLEVIIYKDKKEENGKE